MGQRDVRRPGRGPRHNRTMNDSTESSSGRSGVLWTIGHSTRPAAELIELLQEHKVVRLVDVRTVPRSRHNPQFNRDALPGDLERAGIRYRHAPELGGLRKPSKDSINAGWRNASFRGYADYMQTAEFVEAVERLRDEALGERSAVMCAESVPWRCHRSLIGDALLVRGFEILHILGPGSTREHRLTSFARTDGERVTYPGLV